MHKIIISVQDVKAETFSDPAYVINKPVALRDFATLVNQKGSLINSHPDDFVLWQLGEFDVRSGGIKYNAVALGNARDFVAPAGA